MAKLSLPPTGIAYVQVEFRRGRWVVTLDDEVYGPYDDESDAQAIAKLLRIAGAEPRRPERTP